MSEAILIDAPRISSVADPDTDGPQHKKETSYVDNIIKDNNCCLCLERKIGIDLIGGALLINLICLACNTLDAYFNYEINSLFKFIFPILQLPSVIALIPFFMYWNRDSI
jgi:hypothetical protein